MKIFFQAAQIIIAVLLVATILLQAKGVGVGTIFGGEGQFYKSRRGVEKLLLYATILLSIIFAATSLINLAV